MRHTNFIPSLFVLAFISQGCYTQLAYQDRVILTPAQESKPDTVVVMESSRPSTLVYEYRYWFDDYYFGRGYDPYSIRPAGWFVDLTWYDPFYPYYAHSYYDWPYYTRSYCCYSSFAWYSPGWYGSYGSWYGGGYNYPVPRHEPRDWNRRNVYEPDLPGRDVTLVAAPLNSTRPALHPTPATRPALVRTDDGKAPVVKIEKPRARQDKEIRIVKPKQVKKSTKSSSVKRKTTPRREKTMQRTKPSPRSSSPARPKAPRPGKRSRS